MSESSFFVYSAFGSSSTRVDEAALHDPALVHHRDLLRQGPDQCEVVGDEEEPEVELALQLGEHVDDRRLHRDVERGGDLVADEQLRLGDQRAGDRDALALAARQLVRVAVEARRSRAARARVPRARDLGESEPPEREEVPERLLDDLRDRLPRVERAVGALEHVLDLPSRVGVARPRSGG